MAVTSATRQVALRLPETELATQMRAGYEALSSYETDAEVFVAAQSEVLAHSEQSTNQAYSD